MCARAQAGSYIRIEWEFWQHIVMEMYLENEKKKT